MEKHLPAIKGHRISRLTSIGLAVSTVLSMAGCSALGGERSTPKASATAQSLPPSVTSVDNHTTSPIQSGIPLKTIKQFSAEPVSNKRRSDVAAATVKLVSNAGQCTGLLLNDFVLSAGHCFEGTPGTVRVYRAGNKQVGELATWRFLYKSLNGSNHTGDTSNADIAIARPRSPIPGRIMRFTSISNGGLQPGETFTTTQYPDDITEPITSTLTYLSGIGGSRETFFAANPTKRDKKMLCIPGSSGAPLISDGGDIAVMNWNNEKSDIIAQTGQEAGVELSSTVERLCGATVLTSALFNQLTSEIPATS